MELEEFRELQETLRGMNSWLIGGSVGRDYRQEDVLEDICASCSYDCSLIGEDCPLIGTVSYDPPKKRNY
ncbi:MAG: hypothetical protein ABIG93_04825 [archaeon]